MGLAVLVLAALVAVCMAGAPTVDQSFDLYAQNGASITITGSGFTRFDPQRQFNWILRNSDDTWMSDQTLRGSPSGESIWPGCIPRTLVVNAAGTTVTCTLAYIPDFIIESPTAGVTSIELDVANDNGFLAGGPVTVAIVQNINEQIYASSTNTVPERIYGFTITGEGFPAFESLSGYIASPLSYNAYIGGYYNYGGRYYNYEGNGPYRYSYFVRLDYGDPMGNVFDIDILFSLYFTYQPSAWVDSGVSVGPARQIDPNIDFGAPQNFISGPTYGTGDVEGCECVYDRSRVDCTFCVTSSTEDGLDLTPIGITPNHGLTAELRIRSFQEGIGAGGINYDVIGPTQIAVVEDLPHVVTVDPSSAIYNWNAQEITIFGSGFATFPSIQSNIVAYIDGTNAAQLGPTETVSGIASPFRCDPISVNAAGTRLTCRPRTMPLNNAAPVALQPLTIVMIVGNAYGFAIDPTDGAVSVQVGQIDAGDSTALEIHNVLDPRSDPVQADARYLTITSSSGNFPVDSNKNINKYFLNFNDDNYYLLPDAVHTGIELTGLETGTTTECFSKFPNWADTFSYVYENSAANDPTGNCQIVSMSATEIRLRLPPITEPVGTAIRVTDFTIAWRDETGGLTVGSVDLVGTDGVVVGTVSPGAGVGGDPHFFGFLGEKYEFAGEPGQTYNILTDEEVQLNAVIGKWHFGRGSETIIRKLALKTRNHRVLIDAGGSGLGAPSFSILLNDEPLLPNSTDATHLGADGIIRWNPLARGDNVHLPLWEKHNGVAIVEISLHNYRFQILAIEEGRDENGVWRKQPSRFLDFMCQMFDDTRRPHGLFGQTAHLPAGKRDASDWTLEGTGDDYKVSHPFADDFVFNQFNR